MSLKGFSFLLFFVFVSSFSQEKEWVVLKDLKLQFRIDFPQKASPNSQEVPTDKGNVIMDSYTLNTNHTENMMYMTATTFYPTSFFSNGLEDDDEQEKVLSNAVNGAVNNVKGKLLSNSKITFNGFKGRRFGIELLLSGSQYYMDIQIVLSGLKLYLMQTVCLMNKAKNKDSERFFNSFELINVKE